MHVENGIFQVFVWHVTRIRRVSRPVSVLWRAAGDARHVEVKGWIFFRMPSRLRARAKKSGIVESLLSSPSFLQRREQFMGLGLPGRKNGFDASTRGINRETITKIPPIISSRVVRRDKCTRRWHSFGQNSFLRLLVFSSWLLTHLGQSLIYSVE